MFLKRVNLRLLALRAVPTEGQKRDPENLPHASGMALPAFVGHRSIPRIQHLRAPPHCVCAIAASRPRHRGFFIIAKHQDPRCVGRHSGLVAERTFASG